MASTLCSCETSWGSRRFLMKVRFELLRYWGDKLLSFVDPCFRNPL